MLLPPNWQWLELLLYAGAIAVGVLLGWRAP